MGSTTKILRVATAIGLLLYALTFKISNVPMDSGVNKETAVYVERFNKYANIYLEGFKMPDIDIGFGELYLLHQNGGTPTHETIGLCMNFFKPTVVFDRRYWDHSTPIEREELVFHELGHCALNRDHIEGMDNLLGKSQPKSIMNPYILPADDYLRMRDYYISELFNGAGDAEQPSEFKHRKVSKDAHKDVH